MNEVIYVALGFYLGWGFHWAIKLTRDIILDPDGAIPPRPTIFMKVVMVALSLVIVLSVWVLWPMWLAWGTWSAWTRS